MLQKADIELVRRQNRGLFLETLRAHGPISRSDIGRFTGLSLATVTSISGQLIDEGLVHSLEVDVRTADSKRGRPQTRIGLSPQAASILAISVSIDGVELVLADFNGEIRYAKQLRLKTIDVAALAFGPMVAKDIKVFLGEAGVALKAVTRISVAVQGVANRADGAIAWSPAFLARNIPVVGPLSTILGIPCSIANNANMIAEALNAKDRVRYGGTVAVVYLGHGVGLGLLLNGQVYSGASGRAAEFGHTNHLPGGTMCRCGRRGCLEAYSADYGIARMVAESTNTPFDIHLPVQDGQRRDFERRARAGDPVVLHAFATAGRALGFGLARLVALINPELVVFAGEGTRTIAFMRDAIDTAMEEGLVHDLQKDVIMDVLDDETDMIVRGTIVESLRYLDRDVFAVGQRLEAAE
jgi:predicted NBD/HSP70 family sugar kinase